MAAIKGKNTKPELAVQFLSSVLISSPWQKRLADKYTDQKDGPR
jgi:hypothetical protein